MIELQALIDSHFEARKKEEEEILALKERIVSLTGVVSTIISSPRGQCTAAQESHNLVLIETQYLMVTSN